MDQSSTKRKRNPVGYFGKGRLIGGKGVIFPDSHRDRRQRAKKALMQQWVSKTVAHEKSPHKDLKSTTEDY